MTTASSTSPPPWHTAYPAPKTDPTAIRREEVLLKMQNVTENINQDFILVDLRRNDYEVKVAANISSDT
jgi:arsenical-resistance protein 2